MYNGVADGSVNCSIEVSLRHPCSVAKLKNPERRETPESLANGGLATSTWTLCGGKSAGTLRCKIVMDTRHACYPRVQVCSVDEVVALAWVQRGT